MENSLDKARKIINEVDAEIAKLFSKRLEAAKIIAEYKQERGLPILDEARESEVIARNSELLEDEEKREFYVNFFKELMGVSRAYQYRLMNGMKVAYCGTEGAFAHIASEKFFPSAKKISFSDFANAYKAVEKGECDVCVLPVENSYNGEVGQVTDLMFSGSLYVNEMLDLTITQDLLGVHGAKIEDIKTVVSHPQALGQCAEYIKEHGFEVIEYNNTALAAKYVSQLSNPLVAAIASKEAADIFGLEVIDHDINESKSNTTRFAVFSRVANRKPKKDMSTHSILLFTVRNEAGALAKAIDVIGSFGFNMRTLRSRPMKELLWQYYFYIEIEGEVQTEQGRLMLESLEEYCDKLKFVGTYSKM